MNWGSLTNKTPFPGSVILFLSSPSACQTSRASKNRECIKLELFYRLRRKRCNFLTKFCDEVFWQIFWRIFLTNLFWRILLMNYSYGFFDDFFYKHFLRFISTTFFQTKIVTVLSGSKKQWASLILWLTIHCK